MIVLIMSLLGLTAVIGVGASDPERIPKSSAADLACKIFSYLTHCGSVI